MSKIHILGIAGTFMGGVAALARELGLQVEGSDQAVYPPMSTQLEQLGIALKQGYSPDNISADCDEIIIGNALSRGNAAVEAVLDAGRNYTSGAQWLSEQVLPGRDVLAVAKANGLNIPSGCTFGLCGTCKIRKTKGEVHMVHNGGISDDDIEEGYILACCSHPIGAVSVEV